MANELKKQYDKPNFITEFAKKNGLPVWNNTIRNSPSLNQKSSTIVSGEKEICLIPLQLETGEIKSFIISVKENNSYLFTYYNKDVVSKFNSDKKEKKDFAVSVLSVFSFFEKKINNHDSTSFQSPLIKKIKEVTINFSATNANKIARFVETDITICGYVMIPNGYNVGDAPGQDNNGGHYEYQCRTSTIWAWLMDNNESIVPEGMDGDGGTGGGGSTGGNSSNGTIFGPTIDNLNTLLGLTSLQTYWLSQHPYQAAEIEKYLQTTSQPSYVANQLAKDHLDKMMTDADYLTFVQGHSITSTTTIVWWEDDIWLSNPINFHLDIDRNQNDPYDELTAAEKALLKIYTDQGYRISKNIQNAYDKADGIFGIGGLNDKKDAFRHAYFHAINTRDIFPTLLKTRGDIVRLFGIAHESETPPQLDLEKQMDLHNNDEGISVCGSCFFASDDDLANAVLDKLNNGSLWYLAPLDFVNYPRYDKNNPTCLTCTDGIIPGGAAAGGTIIKPTNQ